MSKAETIEYAIRKECQRFSLVEWCEEWGFSTDDFYKFLELGRKAFEEEMDKHTEELFEMFKKMMEKNNGN